MRGQESFVYSHYKQVVYVNLVRDENMDLKILMLTDHFYGNIEECRELVSMWMMKVLSLVIDEIQGVRMSTMRSMICRNSLDATSLSAAVILPEPSIQRDFFLPAGIAYLQMYPLSFKRILQSIEYRRYIGKQSAWKSESKDEDYQKLEEAYQVYRKNWWVSAGCHNIHRIQTD